MFFGGPHLFSIFKFEKWSKAQKIISLLIIFSALINVGELQQPVL